MPARTWGGVMVRYVRRDRDSKAAGTTLVCQCRCSAVPGSMLLKTGGAGLDGAGGEGPLVACSTGSKPGGNDGGTGIRTRGPGTAAGLRFSSFHRIDAMRRFAGYKTSHANRPEAAYHAVWRRFLGSVGRGFVSGLWIRNRGDNVTFLAC